MIITSISKPFFLLQSPKIKKTKTFEDNFDKFYFTGSNFDKNVFEKRKIISKNTDINAFFDEISSNVFKKEDEKLKFSKYLKDGSITLSSSCYSDLKDPKSAVGVVLDEKKSSAVHLLDLNALVKKGCGVGINFSNFKNPVSEIKQINTYFKHFEPSFNRPPAFIGLLNVNHPEILNFITLKNDADFNDWCFDLSVVLDESFLSKVDNNENIKLKDGSTLPAKKIYETLLNSMLQTGEPGVVFSSSKEYLTDPCACVPLKEGEGFTIGHVNLSKICDNGKINYQKLDDCSKILSLAMKNIDKNSYIGVLGYKDLLNQLNLEYSSNEADEILENCMKIISFNAQTNGLKTAISPTGTVSRFLKTTPSVENGSAMDYEKEIKTLSTAQKYLDGNISKTILLDKNASTKDIDKIIRQSINSGLKGISVFKSK